MWQHNKVGIITLLAGLGLLGGAYYLIRLSDPQLAQQVLALGVCFLLFGVALASWVSVRKSGGEDE